jgi:uncharacterized membrane protein YqiK
MGGEAGFQPDLLRGGWHFLTPFQYRIHKMPMITIPQGKIGYVFARDGHDLPPTQTLASNAKGADFQDVRSQEFALVIFAVVIMGAAMLRFRKRLD